MYFQETILFFEKKYLEKIKTILKGKGIDYTVNQNITLLQMGIKDAGEKLEHTIKIIDLLKERERELPEVHDFQDTLIFIFPGGKKGEINSLLKTFS